MEVGKKDLREACAQLRLQWGALGLAAGADESCAASGREAELALRLRQAQEELLKVTSGLYRNKPYADDNSDGDDADQPLHTFDC